MLAQDRPLTISVLGQRQWLRPKVRAVARVATPSNEIEAVEIRFLAHGELNAVELTVLDQNGRGFRSWIGADRVSEAALRFVGATLRLLGAEPI